MDETQLVGSLISPVGLSYDSLSFFFTDEADETLLTETEDTCKASQRRISPDGGLLSRNKNNALNSQRENSGKFGRQVVQEKTYQFGERKKLRDQEICNVFRTKSMVVDGSMAAEKATRIQSWICFFRTRS